jgi:hypothetical protein
MMASSIFISNYAATGFAIALFGFFLSEQIGGVIIPRIRRGGAKAQRRNVGSNTMVLLSWVVIFTVPLIMVTVYYLNGCITLASLLC